MISFKSRMKTEEIDEFMELFDAFLLILRIKACVPGYVERFGLFFDMESSACSSNFVHLVIIFILLQIYFLIYSVLNFLYQLFGKIYRRIYELCPYFVHKIYIFGETDRHTDSVKKLKKELEGRIKVIEFENGILDYEKLKKEIESETLEKKYGGNLEDLTEFWPPRCVVDATKSLDDDRLLEYGIIPFTFDGEEFSVFNDTINQKLQKLKSKGKLGNIATPFTPKSNQNHNKAIFQMENTNSTSHSLFNKKNIMMKRQQSEVVSYQHNDSPNLNLFNKEKKSENIENIEEILEENDEENTNSLSRNMSKFKNRILRKKSIDNISSRRGIRMFSSSQSSNKINSEDESNIIEDDSSHFQVKEIPTLEFGIKANNRGNFKKKEGVSGGVWGFLKCCTRRYDGDFEKN